MSKTITESKTVVEHEQDYNQKTQGLSGSTCREMTAVEILRWQAKEHRRKSQQLDDFADNLDGRLSEQSEKTLRYVVANNQI